jgi:putative flippase GtrA
MVAAGRRRAALAVAPAGSTLRQVTSFAVIGVVSTAAYAALYAGLRLVLDPVAANAFALVVTAIGNTAANRRLTFEVRDRAGALHDQVGGLLALAVALVITTVAVGVLGVIAPDAGRAAELAVLIAANLLATACRFLLLRRWIAGPRRSSMADHGRARAADLPGATA